MLAATTSLKPHPSIQREASNSRASTSSSIAGADADPIRARPAISKTDREMLKCPMAFTMYSNPVMLRKARNDMATFMRLIDNRLKQIETSEEPFDAWGIAEGQLRR